MEWPKKLKLWTNDSAGEIEKQEKKVMCNHKICDRKPLYYASVHLNGLELYIALCEEHQRWFNKNSNEFNNKNPFFIDEDELGMFRFRINKLLLDDDLKWVEFPKKVKEIVNEF